VETALAHPSQLFCGAKVTYTGAHTAPMHGGFKKRSRVEPITFGVYAPVEVFTSVESVELAPFRLLLLFFIHAAPPKVNDADCIAQHPVGCCTDSQAAA